MPSPPDTALLRAQLERFAAALAAPTLGAADLSMLAGDEALRRRRFGLYRGNVQLNVARALRSAYPVVRALVGDAFFDGLAHEYARAHPSGEGDLNEAGAAFARFLDGFAPAGELPYAGDVARLEWLVHRAHYAADAAPLDVARFAALPHERLGEAALALHPACALFASRWPVATIWTVHQGAHDGPIDVDLDAGGERALVLRPAWRVAVEPLGEGAHAFLAACGEGRTMEQAASAALAREPGFALGEALAGWVGSGVVVDVALRA